MVETAQGARFVFITGLSGSGKTLAMKALEDSGFFCVDNLPAKLILPFAELTAKGGESVERVAIVADLREKRFLEDFPDVYRRLQERGVPTRILFLEASDDIIVRRFSESRRPHPLQQRDASLRDAVRLEREQLAAIRALADRVMDTSELNVHELRRELVEHFVEGAPAEGPNVHVLSFGYKYGVPPEADLVFDVRFLPNPYFETGLRDKTGGDPAVEKFLLSHSVVSDVLMKLDEFLTYLLPHYASEGKSYLTIAIGCTGGKHRSVMVANHLSKSLRGRHHSVKVSHRDVENE